MIIHLKMIFTKVYKIFYNTKLFKISSLSSFLLEIFLNFFLMVVGIHIKLGKQKENGSCYQVQSIKSK